VVQSEEWQHPHPHPQLPPVQKSVSKETHTLTLIKEILIVIFQIIDGKPKVQSLSSSSKLDMTEKIANDELCKFLQMKRYGPGVPTPQINPDHE